MLLILMKVCSIIMGIKHIYKSALAADEVFMSKLKNIAIIGFGGMAGWHADMIRRNNVINLKGVYDIKDQRNKIAEEKGIFAYSSCEELLADKDVDVVLIATPNELHKPLAIEAMKAGKHVISEKPVTLSSADLQEMIDASKKYGRIFTVHQNRRWDNDYIVMKDLYNSDKLGRVFGIESRVQGSHGIPGDWRGRKEHGGGMMLDWGVHLIDQIMMMVGDRRLERVYCTCDHITNDEVDDGFKLDLYFENDFTARVEVGTSHFINLPRFFITGENGSAVIPDWNLPCKVTACKIKKDTSVVPVKTAAGLTKTMAPRNQSTIETYEIELPDPDVHDFYRNVVAAIDGKEDQLIKHDQIMLVMRIMEAAFESDRTHSTVEFKY